MSVRDLEKAFQLLEENPLIIASRNQAQVSTSLINKAEQHLKIQFPNTYKNFLLRFGFLSLGGMEIYGVIDDDFENSSVPDAIWLTSQERFEFNLPHPLVPIMDIGNGDRYCLDTSQMNKEGECPVVVWPIGGYEQTPVLEVVAKDFGEFFLNMVKQEIAYKS